MSTATTIRFRGHGGQEIHGLLVPGRGGSEPVGSGRGPAIVLVHEVFGLDAHIRSLAERFAAEGFTVLAPDLYSREGGKPRSQSDPTSPRETSEGDPPGPQPTDADPAPVWTGEQIRAAVASLPDRRVLGDLEGALERLAGEPSVDPARLGAVGMCMGGNHAYMLGCTSRRVSAVVDFYGRFVYRDLSPNKPIQPLELALNLSCPLLAIFGGRDPSISPADVERFRTVMRQFARDVEVVVFPDAGHGFLNDRRKSHDPSAAQAAWKLAVGYLRERLGDAPSERS